MKDCRKISKNSPPEHVGRAWASDFDRIVAEGLVNELNTYIDKVFDATKQAPNPAPLKDEKK